MRIDDENKVVWCSESEMEWYVSFNTSVGDSVFSDLRRINALSTETEPVLPNCWMTTADRVKTIRVISDYYEFKLEQPQKYYWRKKKEHLAWFEKQESSYVRYFYQGASVTLSALDYDSLYKMQFTEQEARELLKDDFDKFEKVECE